MTTPEARLAALGLAIPPVPAPVAAYIPAVRTGAHVYTSGQLPMVDGSLVATGKDSGTDFTYGIGVKYDFTRNLAARIEWQHYENSDINTIGGGVLWHFR